MHIAPIIRVFFSYPKKLLLAEFCLIMPKMRYFYKKPKMRYFYKKNLQTLEAFFPRPSAFEYFGLCQKYPEKNALVAQKFEK